MYNDFEVNAQQDQLNYNQINEKIKTTVKTKILSMSEILLICTDHCIIFQLYLHTMTLKKYHNSALFKSFLCSFHSMDLYGKRVNVRSVFVRKIPTSPVTRHAL